MNKRLLIYVSGPYSAPREWEREANVEIAMDIALDLARLGHLPFVPHLSHHQDKYWSERGFEWEWERWLEMDARMLPAFDALYRVGSSRGADVEFFVAQSHGLIIYTDMSQVPEAMVDPK